MAITQKSTTLSLNSNNGKGRKPLDPLLSKYGEEGILGVKPGMVKVNGKEMTAEQADAFVKKDAALDRKLEAHMENVEKAKAAREQNAREQDIIADAWNNMKVTLKGKTSECKRNIILCSTFAITR